MKRSRVALLAVLALLLLIGGGSVVLPNLISARTAAIEDEAVPVRPPDIVALGEIVPEGEILSIAGPSGQDAGRLSSILVTEGFKVEKGAVLATLETLPGLGASLQQAVASLEQRQAELARATADAESNEKSLEAQVRQQQAERDLAAWDLEQSTALKQSGLYEEAYLTDKRLALAAAEARLENVSASLERARARTAAGERLDVATAAANVRAAEAALEKALSDREKGYIRAPVSGRILTLYGRLGQEVGAEGFADIANTGTMLVRAEVFETDVAQLEAGMPCSVTSRVLPAPLSGTLERKAIRLSSQSIMSTDPAAVVDARVVEVWIRLDQASSAAAADLSGLQVSVNFGPGRNADV
jgi:HlyD family secretion protein